MTLMANLATLRDLGRAYWVHKYDSNWIAKICGDTHIHNSYAFFSPLIYIANMQTLGREHPTELL